MLPATLPWEYSLGIIALQQIPRPAVALPTYHHQGCKGGQKDGGQHPNGHNHHGLHASRGTFRLGHIPHTQLTLERTQGQSRLGEDTADNGAVETKLDP